MEFRRNPFKTHPNNYQDPEEQEGDTLTLEGTHHIRKLNREQQLALDYNKFGIQSVDNLVRGTHLTKTDSQIPKVANKMVFAMAPENGKLLVAHNMMGYQRFEDNEQKQHLVEENQGFGNVYCDVAHNGKYYFLVSGLSPYCNGKLYLIRDDLNHEKLTLLNHAYDSPFFGKSLYPNPFDPKMMIFCDPCYGWLQCLILGPDHEVDNKIRKMEKKNSKKKKKKKSKKKKKRRKKWDSDEGEDENDWDFEEEEELEIADIEAIMNFRWMMFGRARPFSDKLRPLLESRGKYQHKDIDFQKDWITSFNHSLLKLYHGKLGQPYDPPMDGIIFGNSWDESMAHVISSICFLEKNRILVLIAPSNELAQLRIDRKNRKFILESRKNFTKAFKQNEQSTAMAICPRKKYIIISTRNAINQSRGHYETNLFLYLFRYSKKTGLNFYARFTLKRPMNVASIHDLIFHGYNRNRLIFTANQYNIEDRGAGGEISKGIVSTFMVDFRIKRLSFRRSVELIGDNEQIGSWYRDGSEVISLDNKGAFVRITL